MINKALAKKQGLTQETIEKIEALHKKRDSLEARRLNCSLDPDSFLILWTVNEYRLQELWGFPKNAAYHRFWDAKGCTCPKMDNDDAYPSGHYVINQNCPLHGN